MELALRYIHQDEPSFYFTNIVKLSLSITMTTRYLCEKEDGVAVPERPVVGGDLGGRGGGRRQHALRVRALPVR